MKIPKILSFSCSFRRFSEILSFSCSFWRFSVVRRRFVPPPIKFYPRENPALLKVLLSRAGDTKQKFSLSIEIRLWFASKLSVRISSNNPYDIGDNLAKNLDGHRSKRIKRSECYDKPRRSENLRQELKIGPSTTRSRDR